MLFAPESAILRAIFDAVGASGRWPVMLLAMSDYLRADRCTLFTPSGASDDHGNAAGDFPEILTGLRLGRVYTGEELTDRALPGAGLDAADLRAIGLRAQQGICWLVASRKRGGFRAVDSAALSALAPHITQALDLAERMTALQTQAARASRLARRLGVGVVEFDSLGNCAALDGVARDLLAQAGVMAAQLRAGQGAVQRISDRLELAIPPDMPRIGYLRHTAQVLPAPALIAQALGLSLAEARLARALGMGDTLVQAAARLGLTVETARAYSKQIFAKTGLRGQPDLMRRLWTGALPLC